MLSNPPMEVYYRLTFSAMDQFKKSWIFFVLKMPFLSEKLISANDFAAFLDMWNGKFSDGFTEDDLETYKYVFSKSGSFSNQSCYYLSEQL